MQLALWRPFVQRVQLQIILYMLYHALHAMMQQMGGAQHVIHVPLRNAQLNLKYFPIIFF